MGRQVGRGGESEEQDKPQTVLCQLIKERIHQEAKAMRRRSIQCESPRGRRDKARDDSGDNKMDYLLFATHIQEESALH